MNETIKSFIELMQTLVIGWCALYGAMHFPSLTLPSGYTPFTLATGVWFIFIACGLIVATYECVLKEANQTEGS